METLLEWKEKIRHFYSKNEIYVVPIVKFFLAFLLFFIINKNIGYMKRLDHIAVVLVLALLCAILPANAMVLFGVILTLLHLYALSKEVFLTGAVFFLLLALLYFRFAPKEGYYTALTPICFVFRIPYIMPIAEGLLCKPYAIFSVISGTFAYYFLNGIKMNEALLGASSEDTTAASKFAAALKQLIGNKEMYLVLTAFVVAMLLVYQIRRLSVDHAWTIAILTGVLVQFAILFAGYLLFGINGKVFTLLIGSIVSTGMAFVLKFLFFNVDYTRVERVQFEDDEYYYYVKAVPKISVTQSKKQIKQFNRKTKSAGHKSERITKEALAKEMDIDKSLLK